MLNFDLYAIYTTKSEFDGSVDEFFPSFEEAMAHRMEYSDWSRPKGEVQIRKYPAGKKDFYPSDKWNIRADGSIKEHYISKQR